MVQYHKKYQILKFDKINHKILVRFSSSDTVKNIDLPIENDMYITGQRLHDYILSFDQEIINTKKIILNAHEIENIVDKELGENYDVHLKRVELLSFRATLLRNTDWTELPTASKGMTEEDKLKYIEYRQKLRDVTKQEGWPMNVDWPKMPHILGATIL